MKFLPTLFHISKIQAFTLLETLGSVAILSTFVLGPLTVAINSSTYARQTKDVMVATYLAEESSELLHNQYDSLYILCTKQFGIAPCTATGIETLGSQVAWRLFKERLASPADSGVSSCFDKDNPEGCSYDFIDLSATTTDGFSLYKATNTQCPKLALVSKFAVDDTVPRSVYVCSGDTSPSHSTGVLTSKLYTRTVKATSSITFTGVDQEYNDDIRIVSTISFKRPSGFGRTVTVVDFIHPRQ